MFVIIRIFFERLRFFIKWITGKGFFDMTRGGNIICASILFGGLIIKYVNYNTIKNLVVGVIACVFLVEPVKKVCKLQNIAAFYDKI